MSLSTCENSWLRNNTIWLQLIMSLIIQQWNPVTNIWQYNLLQLLILLSSHATLRLGYSWFFYSPHSLKHLIVQQYSLVAIDSIIEYLKWRISHLALQLGYSWLWYYLSKSICFFLKSKKIKNGQPVHSDSTLIIICVHVLNKTLGGRLLKKLLSLNDCS